MISLIKFDSSLVVERKEATLLGLPFVEVGALRLGYRDNKLQTLGAYDKMLNEDVFETAGDATEYEDINGLKVASYFVYLPPTELDKKKDYVLLPHTEYMVDIAKFAPSCTYPYRILRSIIPESRDVGDITSILRKVEDKVQSLLEDVTQVQATTFNQKCNVHVGGGLIVTYNDIKLRVDTCSDSLQLELNDGWRIIAVCVQPDQRRPDYVLGRYNPSLDTNISNTARR